MAGEGLRHREAKNLIYRLSERLACRGVYISPLKPHVCSTWNMLLFHMRFLLFTFDLRLKIPGLSVKSFIFVA